MRECARHCGSRRGWSSMAQGEGARPRQSGAEGRGAFVPGDVVVVPVIGGRVRFAVDGAHDWKGRKEEELVCKWMWVRPVVPMELSLRGHFQAS